MEKDKIGALDAGADDYVTKPFSMQELLARIRAGLRRSPLAPEAAPQTLQTEGLEINFTARRVVAGGLEIRLTRKEFDLLQFLAASPNTPIPHRRLLQAVWGPDYGNEVVYLRVFINQLRKKIEPEPARPRYILTEPCIGYQFHVPQDAGKQQ
jgi:two-component system KDP operon response regulator KdpE